ARFTRGDVTPMAIAPRTAARRPAGPPIVPRAAAIASHRTEWLAALESRRSGSSSGGVGGAATPGETARTPATHPPTSAAARSRPGPPCRSSASATCGVASLVVPAAGSPEPPGPAMGVSCAVTGLLRSSLLSCLLLGSCCVAVQGGLELLLCLLGQGGLQHR